MSLRAEHAVFYDVDVFDRTLIVAYNGDVANETVYGILDARYDQWNHIDENPEVEYYCCEEWMLMGLDGLGINYTPIYEELEENHENN